MDRKPPPSAGASAQREYERRRDSRRTRARQRYGALGAALTAITAEPQSTTAWKQGADAERMVAAALERRLRRQPVVVMHDRVIPGRGNIDHLAIGPGGVTVIDTKSSRGRLELKRVGGILSARQQLLVINGRDRTRELQKLHRQLHAVQAALAAAGLQLVPVAGALCYPHADGIPLLGTLRSQTGIIVTHPRGAARLVCRPGPLSPEQIRRTAEELGRRLPPA